MEMIQSVVDKGKQAIVLIPEIALTYQTVMRFYRRFKDRVSVMNSRLSAGDRYDQMMRANAGGVDVKIGNIHRRPPFFLKYGSLFQQLPHAQQHLEVVVQTHRGRQVGIVAQSAALVGSQR